MTTLAAQLYLLFTPELCRNAPFATLADALRGGVQLVQWRVARRDIDGLRRCLEVCAAHGVDVIVNNDVELAISEGARGAHVGTDDLPVARARALLGAGRWLGASTHDLQQVAAAARDGADHFGFGPCFPTTTKGYSRGLGPRALAAALAATPLPIYAIGGITVANLPALRAVGCTRIAVSSAILQAAEPYAAARELRELLE